MNKPKEERPPPLPKGEAMARLEVVWMRQRIRLRLLKATTPRHWKLSRQLYLRGRPLYGV